MRLILSAVAATFSLTLTSCANGPVQIYAGPALPDSQTALIMAPRAPSDRTAANIRILSADDARGDPVQVTSRSIRVVPRGVCIEARATSSTQDSLVSELCFNAYEGNSYEVRAVVTGASSGTPTAVPDINDMPDLQNAQTGPFRVSGLFVVDRDTQMIVAGASP
jgi:hypothetical protein